MIPDSVALIGILACLIVLWVVLFPPPNSSS